MSLSNRLRHPNTSACCWRIRTPGCCSRSITSARLIAIQMHLSRHFWNFGKTLRSHGARGCQFLGYFTGKRPRKVCPLKVPKDSPLAAGGKAPDKDGLVQIGEFRAEGGQIGGGSKSLSSGELLSLTLRKVRLPEPLVSSASCKRAGDRSTCGLLPGERRPLLSRRAAHSRRCFTTGSMNAATRKACSPDIFFLPLSQSLTFCGIAPTAFLASPSLFAPVRQLSQ